MPRPNYADLAAQAREIEQKLAALRDTLRKHAREMFPNTSAGNAHAAHLLVACVADAMEFEAKMAAHDAQAVTS